MIAPQTCTTVGRGIDAFMRERVEPDSGAFVHLQKLNGGVCASHHLFSHSFSLRNLARSPSQAAGQKKNDDNDDDQTETSARVISP
jgi:hypothetical protein